MERLIKINQNVINGGNQSSLPQILKLIGVSREYCVNGVWTNEKPSKKPEGARVVFSSLEQFRIAKDVYFIWQDIVSQQTFPPEFLNTILDRLFKARLTSNPLVLFIPWGVRPAGIFGESEIKALGKIENLQKDLNRRNISTRALIMPADIYATEINNQVDPSKADRYFEIVSSEATTRGFMVKPWSEIRVENQEKYNQLYNEISPEGILPKDVLSRALQAAERISGYQKKERITAAAFAYLKERICEAEIIESVYEPIKVSMVEKGKDAYVDRNLPRIYILDKSLQFPWLK